MQQAWSLHVAAQGRSVISWLLLLVFKKHFQREMQTNHLSLMSTWGCLVLADVASFLSSDSEADACKAVKNI